MATKSATPDTNDKPALSFYRKYRPNNLDEIIGHEDIVDQLYAAIDNNAVPSAMLLVGKTSAGKTTLARAFANTVLDSDNCLKHSDYKELNCTEDSRIDVIRDIITIAKLRPTSGKRRIIMLDEAQGVLAGANSQSAQALLKAVEEPAPNTTWILASMDPVRFDATKEGQALKNRCQVFNLQSPGENELRKYLRRIAKGEGMDYALDFEAELIEACNYTYRTLANLMEGLRNTHDGLRKGEKLDIKRLTDSVLSQVSSVDTSVANYLYALYSRKMVNAQKILMTASANNTNFVTWVRELQQANMFLFNNAVMSFDERKELRLWPSPAAKALLTMLGNQKIPTGEIAQLNTRLIEVQSEIMRFMVSPEALLFALSYRWIMREGVVDSPAEAKAPKQESRDADGDSRRSRDSRDDSDRRSSRDSDRRGGRDRD